MKAFLGNFLLLPCLLSSRSPAQSLRILHSFDQRESYPQAGLVLSGNTLYGTATGFPTTNTQGEVFSMSTDGTGFKELHSFAQDGHGNPIGDLLLSDDILYGTTALGGRSEGTVFAINKNGTGFTNLYSFFDVDPLVQSGPYAGLVLSGNTLYGTTLYFPNEGSVFKVNTDGTGFTILHDFHSDCFDCFGNPTAALVLSSNTLYGTATFAGTTTASGTVFKLNTDGTGFTNLYTFSGGEDGYRPMSTLVLCGNTLYGTTAYGGAYGHGTVFAVEVDGTRFATLHHFNGTNDGSNPWAGLVLAGSTLYGTTARGGAYGFGTIFRLNTNGTGFVNLHSFHDGPNDGGEPMADLLLSGSTLYGTTYEGGSSGYGTVFSLSVPPELTIIQSGTNIILAWSTNFAGFVLQSATNVNSGVWATNSVVPAVVNGQNTSTNPISGTQQFFRLSQ